MTLNVLLSQYYSVSPTVSVPDNVTGTGRHDMRKECQSSQCVSYFVSSVAQKVWPSGETEDGFMYSSQCVRILLMQDRKMWLSGETGAVVGGVVPRG